MAGTAQFHGDRRWLWKIYGNGRLIVQAKFVLKEVGDCACSAERMHDQWQMLCGNASTFMGANFFAKYLVYASEKETWGESAIFCSVLGSPIQDRQTHREELDQFIRDGSSVHKSFQLQAVSVNFCQQDITVRSVCLVSQHGEQGIQKRLTFSAQSKGHWSVRQIEGYFSKFMKSLQLSVFAE